MSASIKTIQDNIFNVLKTSIVKETEAPLSGTERLAVKRGQEAALEKIDQIISKFFQADPSQVDTEVSQNKKHNSVFKKVGPKAALHKDRVAIVGTVKADVQMKKNTPENLYVMMYVYMPHDGKMVEVDSIHANGTFDQISHKIANVITNIKNKAKPNSPHLEGINFLYDKITQREEPKRFSQRLKDILNRS